MNKFITNATNLHVGGGVKAAPSFNEELSLIKKKNIWIKLNNQKSKSISLKESSMVFMFI